MYRRATAHTACWVTVSLWRGVCGRRSTLPASTSWTTSAPSSMSTGGGPSNAGWQFAKKEIQLFCVLGWKIRHETLLVFENMALLVLNTVSHHLLCIFVETAGIKTSCFYDTAASQFCEVFSLSKFVKKFKNVLLLLVYTNFFLPNVRLEYRYTGTVCMQQLRKSES